MASAAAKVAIVTGASGMRGIGRAVALRFARDGLDIALVDIHRPAAAMPQTEIDAGWNGIDSVRAEIEALGRRAISIHADVSDPQQVADICARTVRELGSFDVLVNSARAGLGRDRAPVVELELPEWDRVMSINARGSLMLAQAAARHFVARGIAGRIILMSSLAGKRGMPLHAAYTMSKFAVNGLVQVLASELGQYGITVNAICPGVVDTGRFNLSEKLEAERLGISAEERNRAVMHEYAKRNALRRVASSDDVAGMAAFLISPDGVHVTGQAINVDGGECFH